MKKIAILGSTGSIGTQTLEVIRENKDIEVTGLAAGTNVDLLEKQIREFQPKLVAMWTEEKAKELKSRIRDLDVKVVSGMDGLLEIATMEESEILVTAIVGMIGIRPTIAAIKAGKDIALANKETLVTAGHIIMPLAKECGVKILPVDSEHSAIFQSLQGSHGKNELKKILLTVYDALKEKGYNPISQIVGYILSEDPTYITTHNNARSLIRRIDRDELLKAMVRSYLGE